METKRRREKVARILLRSAKIRVNDARVEKSKCRRNGLRKRHDRVAKVGCAVVVMRKLAALFFDVLKVCSLCTDGNGFAGKVIRHVFSAFIN